MAICDFMCSSRSPSLYGRLFNVGFYFLVTLCFLGEFFFDKSLFLDYSSVLIVSWLLFFCWGGRGVE